MKILAHILTLLASSTFCNACAGQTTDIPTAPMSTKIEIIAVGQQCNISESMSASWINNPQQLETVLKKINRHILNAKVTVPKVNFANHGVVVVSMGTQRTGGYGLALSKSPLAVKGDTATLKLNWKKPARGMMTIQMITSPCLLIKLPKGNYKFLRIVTLTGKEIATVDTTH